MGVDIYGMETDKKLHDGYSSIHLLKWLASKIEGYRGSYSDHFEYSHTDEFWKNAADGKFEQILHLSDWNTVLVPDENLEGINFGSSYKLGSSTKLLEELEEIRKYLVKDKNIAEEREREFVSNLYDLVNDELENGHGIIYISG